MKNIICMTLALGLSMPLLSHAEMTPHRLAQDYRIQSVVYDPNNIVVLKCRYGYQTQILFAEDETVSNVSMGDSLAWQAVPVGNQLFIKPMATSTTNMTVLTNNHSYNFHLESHDTNQAPTYKLQFVYPQLPNNLSSKHIIKAKNSNYSYTGDKSLVPLQIFDDGQFTYLKFNTDGYHHTPAIFTVDKHRNERLVNYHREDDYVVINGVAKQFTLRHGAYVTSIYNDFAIRHKL